MQFALPAEAGVVLIEFVNDPPDRQRNRLEQQINAQHRRAGDDDDLRRIRPDHRLDSAGDGIGDADRADEQDRQNLLVMAGGGLR